LIYTAIKAVDVHFQILDTPEKKNRSGGETVSKTKVYLMGKIPFKYLNILGGFFPNTGY
jgi:hypothetical protein